MSAVLSDPKAPIYAELVQRKRLLRRFADRIAVNPDLSRQLVSFQANRSLPVYSWFKYKEGFSAPLIDYFLTKLTRRPGIVLDPFAGSGAGLFAARDRQWGAVGIEVLPVGCFLMQARLAAETVDVRSFRRAISLVESRFDDLRYSGLNPFDVVPITRGAFPEKTVKSLLAYKELCQKKIPPGGVRTLMLAAALGVLESVSYTRKDGQYLRWDHRSKRSRGTKDFDKGRIPDFESAVRAKLSQMLFDLDSSQLFGAVATNRGPFDLRRGTCLEILPTLNENSVDLIITSPPYCNRYDYTRTYALELVFLGESQDEIRSLRQAMLSCTVENNEKTDEIKTCYGQMGKVETWKTVHSAFREQHALHEVLDYLNRLRAAGQLNNLNISRMVQNYFYEMAFVIHELARVLKPGGRAVIVNDNVRYAGEEVPVDLILCDFAESFGLVTRNIWTLPRGKGNSSQQMGNHGRQEIRKCVYVWEKR